MITFRDLAKDEIEVRVQSVKEKGLILLLYKNARCDMNILDETVGAENWQREHYECKGNLYCRVGLRIYLGCAMQYEWVWKSDCGAESNTDAEKGEASDSFKRACVNWGIGRELYTSPFIWVDAGRYNAKDTGRKDKYGKPILECKDTFIVEKITIENKKIKSLIIQNTSLKTERLQEKRVFVYGTGEPKKETPKEAPQATPSLTFEKALDLVVTFGKHNGLTLREIYKTDREYIAYLMKNAEERIKEAIGIINAEVKKQKENKEQCSTQ